jgi:hypothetical protein
MEFGNTYRTAMKSILKVLGLTLLIASGLANAESVPVKYIGTVDLETYQCQSTSSSFLHRVCYDGSAGSLVLLLKDTYYKYCGVPSSAATGLLSASSKGRYFNSSIKGRYPCS